MAICQRSRRQCTMTSLLKQKLVMLQKTVDSPHTPTSSCIFLRVFLKSSLTTSRLSIRRIRPCIMPIGYCGPPSPHKPIAIGHSDIVIRDGPCSDRRNESIRAAWRCDAAARIDACCLSRPFRCFWRIILAGEVSGPAHHPCLGGVKC
jgi:hypothetical protein